MLPSSQSNSVQVRGMEVTKTIAVAGKGGTGKTTISALVIDYLARNKQGSVLAIDADPSTNLNLALGVPLYDTVGDVREETATAVGGSEALGGMSKWDYLDFRINEALVEETAFDLLAMGRPEGPGCYCAANNILRTSVDRLSDAYDYVVIDNEAGLEHLSRRTTRDVDLLLLVSDPSLRGIIAAGRVAELVDELKTAVGAVYLIVNRVNGDTAAGTADGGHRRAQPQAGGPHPCRSGRERAGCPGRTHRQAARGCSQPPLAGGDPGLGERGTVARATFAMAEDSLLGGHRQCPQDD